MKKKSFEELKDGFGVFGVIITIAAVAILGGFFGYQYLKLQKIQEGATMPTTESSVPAPAPQQTEKEMPVQSVKNDSQLSAPVTAPSYYPKIYRKTIKKSSPSTPDYAEIELKILKAPEGIYKSGDTLNALWEVKYIDGNSYNTANTGGYLVVANCDDLCIASRIGSIFVNDWPTIIGIKALLRGELSWIIPENFLPTGDYKIALVQGSEAASRVQLLGTSESFKIIGGINFAVYRNSTFGFEFKYPTHFVVKEEEPPEDELINLAIGTINPAGIPFREIQIRIIKNPGNSLDEWLNTLMASTGGEDFVPLFQDATVEMLTIGGISAKRIIPMYGYSRAPSIYFIHKENGYIISLNAISSFFLPSEFQKPKNYFLEIEKQLLSSFKFKQ